MTANLDLAYRTLQPGEQEAYRLIGLHPGTDFGPEVIAAVLGTDRARAEHRLDVLAGASLVTRLPDGYYQVSHEVHAHAAEQTREDDHEGEHPTTYRVAVWYLRGARVANGFAMPQRRVWVYEFDKSLIAGGPPSEVQERPSALSWLERHRTVLIALVQQASERGWHELAYQLADACLVLFIKHGHVQDTVTVCELGYESARVLGDVEAQMSFAKRLARAYATLGDFDRADEYGEIMRPLVGGDAWRESNYLKYLAFTKARRGIQAVKNGRPGDATELWQQAAYSLQASVGIARALDRRRSEGLTLTDLGEVWLYLDDIAKAIDVLNQAHDVLMSVGEDSYNVARVDYLLGLAHAKAGDHTAAYEYLNNRALRVFTADGSTHYIALITQTLADLPQP